MRPRCCCRSPSSSARSVGWRRAVRRGGDRLDKLQYAAVHGILFVLVTLVATLAAAALRAPLRCSAPFFAELARRQGPGLAAGVPRASSTPSTLGLARYDAEGFYHLARAALVKDERHFDRFDRVFAAVFGGLESLTLAGDRRRGSTCPPTGCASSPSGTSPRRSAPRSRRWAASTR